MKIFTESISKYLEETFKKDSKDLLITDVLSILFISVNGEDDNNKKLRIDYKDLLLFKNLKYLEIADAVITNRTIDILSELDYLENIVFRNCTFNRQVKNLDKLKNIKSIRILNCKNFDVTYLKELDNLERLYISDKTLDNLSHFNTLKLEALDISECNLKNDLGLDKVHTNYLVLSGEQYNKFKEKILNLNMRIMIMADPSYGYYIEKWLN